MKLKLLLMLLTTTLVGTNTSAISQMDIPFVSNIINQEDTAEKLKELDQEAKRIKEKAQKNEKSDNKNPHKYDKEWLYEDINTYLNAKECLREYKAYLLGADEEFLYKNTIGNVNTFLVAFNFPRLQSHLENPYTDEEINKAVDLYSKFYNDDVMDLDKSVERGLKILQILESESKDGFIDYRLRKDALAKIENMPNTTPSPTETPEIQNETKEDESNWLMKNLIYFILLGGGGISLIVYKLIQHRRYAED